MKTTWSTRVELGLSGPYHTLGQSLITFRLTDLSLSKETTKEATGRWITRTALFTLGPSPYHAFSNLIPFSCSLDSSLPPLLTISRACQTFSMKQLDASSHQNIRSHLEPRDICYLLWCRRKYSGNHHTSKSTICIGWHRHLALRQRFSVWLLCLWTIILLIVNEMLLAFRMSRW